jgi:hypothetical protein
MPSGERPPLCVPPSSAVKGSSVNGCFHDVLCRGKTIGLEAKRTLEGGHPYQGVLLMLRRPEQKHVEFTRRSVFALALSVTKVNLG